LIWARDGKPILVLDGVGNPHNLGAIARSAAFLGVERVVLADRAEQAVPSDASYRSRKAGLSI
jgi:TrmH RNA methyltransferase